MLTEPAVTEPPDPPRRRRLALLRDVRFTRLWLAYLLTGSADFFSYIALSWVALDLTRSGAVVAAVLGIQTLARVALLLVGGALVDRSSPRLVMLRASIGRFVLTAAIAALLAARLLPIGALFVAAAALGVVGALFTPARQSALPGLVADDDLEAGNAIMQVTAELAGVVGPVLAGLIVAAAGTAAAFAADAVAYGIAAVSVLGLPRGDAAPQERGGLLAGVRDGLGSAWSDVPLRAVVAVIAAINFTAAGPLDVGLAVLARNRWGGAWSFGLILGAFAAGAVLGAVAIGASPRRPRVGPLMIGLCVWLGVGMAALGVAGLVAAVVDALLMGVGVGVVGVVGVAWIQRRTPAARLGRVMALVTLSGVALAPLSYAIAGPLVALSPPLLFAAAGALMLAIGAACAASREVRTV